MPSVPADVASLLRLLTADPGRPRLTWYGDDGERVELSGAVLENWVNKTTNLLVEELDAEPGTRVRVDLPAHWRTVLWVLAAWRAGTTIVLGGPDGGPDDDRVDIVVATPGAPSVGATLVVVTLAALARRADGPLPAGAIDAAAAVMTYGDQLGWTAPADPATHALAGADGAAVTHAGLAGWWAPRGERARVLLGPSSDDDPTGEVTDGTALATWLRAVLATLAGDGSLVLLSPARAAHLARPEAADELARLVASERVTETRLTR